MQTTGTISALASAALLFGAAQTAAFAQTTAPTTAPAMTGTARPMTTPTKAPVDVMTPAAAPTAGGGTSGGAMGGTTPGIQGTLAIDARALRARRTATGYTLSGQALVKDACQTARFDPSLLTIFPPQFNLDQFRSPSKMGVMCVQRLIWVTALPHMVASTKPPAYITVRTQKRTTRVPIR